MDVDATHQLHAKVKRGSKYFDQNDAAKQDPSRWGWPFRVMIEPGDPAGYVVIGGPGGRYRLADVNLFVVVDGVEMRIS